MVIKEKEKKGWIRVVESFVAILLITGVVLVILNQGYGSKKNISVKVYDVELSILREIQYNDTLRGDILNVTLLPVEWDDFESKGLTDVKELIIDRIFDYLNCEAKVCSIDDDCISDISFDKDLYVQSIIISATYETYSPRQLKLFCWVK